VRAAITLALRNRVDRRILALFCLALFFTLQLFAASSTLHQAIHADANSPGHHCVITLLAQGQLDAPVVSAGAIALMATLLFCLLPATSARFSSFDYRFSSSRAPPRC
jgi:hypothetical protein